MKIACVGNTTPAPPPRTTKENVCVGNTTQEGFIIIQHSAQEAFSAGPGVLGTHTEQLYQRVARDVHAVVLPAPVCSICSCDSPRCASCVRGCHRNTTESPSDEPDAWHAMSADSKIMPDLLHRCRTVPWQVDPRRCDADCTATCAAAQWAPGRHGAAPPNRPRTTNVRKPASVHGLRLLDLTH